MSTSTKHSSFFLVLALIACCSVLLSGCGQGLLSQPDPGSGEEGAFDEIDLSGSSGDADNGGEGEDGSAEENVDDGPKPVMLSCPAEPMNFNLELHHTWDFSPNRDTKQFKIDGETAVLVFCPLTIYKETVTMPQCWFPVTNNGTINTDAGPCTINATGGGYLEMVRGKCKDGVVTITVLETVDADAGLTGENDCPKAVEPFFAFYPASQNTLTYFIAVGGETVTIQGERAVTADEMDISGAYHYTKEWTLYTPDLPLPESEE